MAKKTKTRLKVQASKIFKTRKSKFILPVANDKRRVPEKYDRDHCEWISDRGTFKISELEDNYLINIVNFVYTKKLNHPEPDRLLHYQQLFKVLLEEVELRNLQSQIKTKLGIDAPSHRKVLYKPSESKKILADIFNDYVLEDKKK